MSRAMGFASAVAAWLPSVAMAHPGHGTTEPASVAHYAFEPLHAVPAIVLLLSFGASALVVRRRRKSATKSVRKS